MANASETALQQLWAPEPKSVELLHQSVRNLGYQVTELSRRTTRYCYLDTDDWWLFRAGAACALRVVSGEATLTLEPLAPVGEVPIDEEQLKESLSAPPEKLRGPLPGERLACWVAPLMGDREVSARLGLLREVTVCRISSAGGPEMEMETAQVALAEVAASGSFFEIMLKAPSQQAEELAEISRHIEGDMGLKPPEEHVLRRAASLAGIELPGLVEGDELKVLTEDRFVDASYRVLRRHFSRMLWNEPGTRLGLDPEYLHDMRVATRRMRAALRVFRGALPPRRASGLRRELRWIGNALGRVRDLDVYITHLQDMIREISPPLQSAMEPYLKRLRSRRERLRNSMLATLRSKRYAMFVARFRKFLDAGPPANPSAPRAKGPVTTEARRVILKSLRRVVNDGRAIKQDSPDSQLHQLRIRCKRLRYACEFFVDIYGGSASKFANRVTKLQDLLGDHQDSVVARRILAESIAHVPAPRRRARELYAGMGELTALHTQRAGRDRRAFAKMWQRFDRRKVRKLLEDRLAKLQLT